MTINKISRSGTSVVTLAELQSGSAIFVQKAARVSTAGPVITGGLVSRADIIKRGVQVQTIVGRAIANPYGSIFNFFEHLGLSDEAILLLARQVALADQFFITHNTPKFLLNKGLNDSEPILERISLRIAAFRVFEDAQFVSTATKLTLTRPLADSQNLIDFARISAGYQRAAADIQNIVDTRLRKTIGKTNQDAVTQSVLTSKRVTALKRDQATFTEAKALLPGKGIFDGVTVRNHDDPGPALFVTKLLRDATTILDLTGIFDGLTYQNIMYRFDTVSMSDDFARTITADRRFNDAQSVIEKIFLQRGVNYQDTATPVDSKRLSITVVRADDTVVTEALQRAFLAQRVFQDTEIIAEVKTLTAGLGKTDVATMLERLVNAVSKANTDTAIVTENIIGKSSIKELTDSIISSEAIAKLINKGLTDEVTIIEDILILLINFIRVNADSVDALNSQPIFSVGKRLTDTTVNLDQNYKDIGKAAQDSFSTTNDRPVFAVSKYLADIASMSDLAAAFDGITYNYGLGRLDAAQATDEFIRQFTAFRTLEEQVSITDVVATARGIGFAARTDTATVTDTIIRGTLKFETLFIGSGQDQRSRTEERISFSITKKIDTNYVNRIDNNADFFTGVQENLIGIVAGQTFTGSTMFASTSAGASVQVVSTGTGLGIDGGFATVYGNPYISFNGTGNRTVATVPIDFTAITSVSINFAYIAGNNGNGGEQPDLNEDLVIEYSIDGGANFVTAATIAAISTYGSPGWSQYTSSLPTAAKTSSTILRWRQTTQSISTGDNWGITNIQLGGTSSGIFIRTYYDNNTASIADKIGFGRFVLPGPDYVSFWQPPIRLSSNLTYLISSVSIGGAISAVNFKNIVQSKYSGRWHASDFNYPQYYWSVNGIVWNRMDQGQPYYGGQWLGIDTTGVAIVSVHHTQSLPIDNEYSTDGGQTWTKATTAEAITFSSSGSHNPVYRAGASYPSFVYSLTTNSANGVCIYMYTSGTATSLVGARWSRGAAFPGIFEGGVNGTTNTLKIRGTANGSGTTVVYLTNYFNFGALYTLTDAATLGTAFTLTTSLSANRALFAPNQLQAAAHGNVLAFGNGRFVWISQNGNLLTTTSPTVSASWQSFNLEATNTSYTTGATTYGSFVGTPGNWGIHNSITYDQVGNRFIITNYTTSFATAKFWISNTGSPGTWSSVSVTSLGITADPSLTPYAGTAWASSYHNVWPGTIPIYTTSTATVNTSISRVIVAIEGSWGMGYKAFPFYFGNFDTYNEADSPWQPDRVTFGYGITAKQGTSVTVSSQTTTAFDTERLYIGSQVPYLIGSSAFVGYSSVLASSSTVTPPGNMFLWSENFETSIYTKSSISVTPDQDYAPDGTYTADKIVVSNQTNSLKLSTLGRMAINTNYTISFHARVDDYSSSIGKGIAFEHFDNLNGYRFYTSITLTQFWQRYSVNFTTGASAPGSAEFRMFFGQGGIVTPPLLSVGAAVYLWGLQLTTGNTHAARVGYTRTTSASISAPGGSQTINEYTTSNLYSSSVGWRYPLYFVGTEVSSYTQTGFTGNMLTWSENFSTSINTVVDAAITTDAALAPDGTTTAEKMVLTGANGAIERAIPGRWRAGGTQYTMRVWVKGDGSSVGRNVMIYDYDFGNRSGQSSITLTADWQILTTTYFPVNNTTDFNWPQLQPGASWYATNTNPLSIGQAVFLWGWQYTTGSFVAGYTRTTSTALAGASSSVPFTIYTTAVGAYAFQPMIRSRDDNFEKVSFLIGQNPRENLTAAETTKFLLTSIRKFDETANIAENRAFRITMPAYRGVAGQVQLKTINAAGNQAQSSVLFSYGARSPDVVGTIDLIFVAIIKTSTFADSISIGSGIDQRQSTTERISFAITKANTDTVSISDQSVNSVVFNKINRDTAVVTERPVFDVAISKTDTVTADDVLITTRGKGLIEIVTVVDNLTQSISLLKADNQDVAENRILDVAVSKADNITQQSLILLTAIKSVNDTVLEDDQLSKLIGLNKVDVLDAADRNNFDVALTAYRGVAGTVTLNTIDPNPDVEFEQSSVTVVRGARSPDEVGMLDLFSLLYIINRQLEDAIAAADDRAFFTITKTFADSFVPDDFLTTFDGLTYAGFMLRQDSIDAAHRMFMDVVLGARTELASIADLTAIAQGKLNTDTIGIGTDAGFRNTNGLETTNFDVIKLAGNLVVTTTSSGSSASVGGSGAFNVGTVNRTFQIATNSAFTYGTGDFTVEWWSQQTASGGVQGLWRNSTGDAVFTSGFLTITQNSGRLTVTQGDGVSGYLTLTSNTTLALNTWHHYAYVKYNGVHKLYVDGTAQNNSFTWLTSVAQVGFMQIGNAGGQYSGYITNFRIVKGTAVYTSNFTPPTTPLTAIAGTQLLVLFTSSGGVNVDSSPNNFTLTPTSGGPVWSSSTPLTAAAESSTTTTSYTNTHPVVILDTKRLLIGLNRQDNVDALDVSRLFSTYIRRLTEVQNINELKALSISKYNVDGTAINDVISVTAINNKFLFDAVFNADAAQFAISQFTNNIVTGLDALALNQSKTLFDSVAVSDAVKKTVGLTKTDVQILTDRYNLTPSLFKQDSALLVDAARLAGSFKKSDDTTITHAPIFFTVTKTFADSFVPDDFLQTFDGLTYAYATSRYDEIINSQRVYLDMVLGARTDTVVSLEQILVAQLKRYDDSVAEADQLQLRINNLINNIAIAADVQTFSVAAIKADSTISNERKYLDIAKSVAADTISLADLIDLILFVPTPDQFYFDTIFISDGRSFNFTKNLSRLALGITASDRTNLDVAIVAHRGVAGTVTLNTIDPSPDVEFAQSSVTVSRSSADNDEVGMLDFFSLTYATVRTVTDSIASTDVAPKFAITKLLRDSAVPDDFLQTFDGLTYATTILKQDVISIGLPGFTGPRVSGDNRERIAIDVAVTKSDAVSSIDTRLTIISGKGNSDAVDNSDALALRVSILKTDVQIVADTQRFFDITTSRSDSIINQDALRRDISKLLGSTEELSITDLLALALQYRLSLSDIQSILAEKDGHFSYLLAQTLRNDDLSVDDDRLASFISKDLTNLDGLNNINTMVSNGTLRMTDYADIDYFAEDYVGESRSFT